MISKRISFNGKFSDLIPMGFKFQKLFARNYRSYRLGLESQPGVTEHTFWIWQHYGGYMEIDDLGHAYSAALLEYAINAPPDEPFDFSESYRFAINKKNNEFKRDHTDVYGEMMYQYHYALPENKQKIVDDFYDTWRMKSIWSPLFTTLRKWHSSELIAIETYNWDKRKIEGI